jgi:RHS repeat-associated protein
LKPNGDSTEFLYDFDGNLIKQTVVSAGVESSKVFVLDDLKNVVYESDSEGNQFSILTGRKIDQHLAVISSDGEVTFSFTYSLNSTVARTNHTGNIDGTFFYEPFGETNSSGGNYPFTFTGRSQTEDGLYYYRARFYDPVASRFISEDPSDLRSGDFNPFRYVANNPTNFTDPEGETFIVAFAATAIFVATVAIVFAPTIRALNQRSKAYQELLDAIDSQDPNCLDQAQRKLEQANKNLQIATQATQAGGDLIIEPSPEGVLEWIAQQIGQAIGEAISRRKK